MIHTNFYRKALWRKPVRTILLLLLLAALTYAFTAHAVEGILVLKETDRLEEYYKPIGELVSKEADIGEGAELVAGCPYVEYEDIRRSCPGVMQGIQNADTRGYTVPYGLDHYEKLLEYIQNHPAINPETWYDEYIETEHTYGCSTAAVTFTGRLEDSRYVEGVNECRGGSRYEIPDLEGEGGYYELTFEVQEVGAGYTDYVEAGKRVHVRCLPGFELAFNSEYSPNPFYPVWQDEMFLREYAGMETGETYLLCAFYVFHNQTNPRLGSVSGNPGNNFVLDTLLPDGDRYFYRLEEGENLEEAAEKIPGFSDYIEFLKRNLGAVSCIGTKDMERMPEFQESRKSYYLTAGRFLTKEDDRQQAKVCVVNDYLARRRGLEVGDKLCLRREAVAPYCYGYLLWTDWEEKKDCEKTEDEFEIVGICSDLRTAGDYLPEDSFNIFLPDSCIPEGYEQEDVLAGGGENYSFVLKKPEDRQRFLEEYKERLSAMGIEVQFVENRAENFAVTAEKTRRSTKNGILLYGVILCVGEILLCGLYTGQKKREFVIARALGVPGKRAASGAVMAFLWLAVPGVLLGSITGWRQTLQSAKKLLRPLEELAQGEGELILSLWWLALFAGMAILMHLLLLCAAIRFLAARPVLPLLQGGRMIEISWAGRKRQKETEENLSSDIPADISFDRETAVLDGVGKDGGIPETSERLADFRYLFRHLVRAFGNTALVLTLSAGALLLFGWMQDTIRKNGEEIERIYHTTAIEGTVTRADNTPVTQTGGGFLLPESLKGLEESGLTEKIYMEETTMAGKVYGVRAGEERSDNSPRKDQITALGIDDWEEFTGDTGAGLTFQFAEGNGGETFLADEGTEGVYQAVPPVFLMETLGLTEGDMLYLYDTGSINVLRCRIIGSYQGECTNGVVGGMPVLLNKDALHRLGAAQRCYGLAPKITFTSAKNRELLERKEELEKLVADSGNPILVRLLLWDGDLTEAVEPMERTISLFTLLYPVAAGVFLILGAGFQLFLLLLRSKEVAVMRVLGKSAGSIRRLFIAEQAGLCLGGLFIGLLLFVSLGWQAAWNIWQAVLLYLAGSLVGILAGSFAVTGKKPLELLQVKE